MNLLNEWFKPRILYYFAHLFCYFFLFIITGWDLYPHKDFLLHSLTHGIFIIPLLFIFSFYPIRLLLYKQMYALFILSGVGFILLSWLIAYYIYPQAGAERINLPFFITNRFILLFVPTIIEIIIQNSELRNKFQKIQLMEQILHLNQQLNPHLLFNTLTTLHHQILIKSPKAELISVKLRDLMEYSLNQSTNVWATLESEINFLKSYIDVEKISLQKESQLQFHTQYDDLSIKVPVMIFIVFLENAFKHSDIDTNEHGFIEAILHAETSQILFQVKNTKTNSSNKKSKKIGLENVVRRLDIMFPKKYKLIISDENMIYQVNLRLNITQTAFL